jgi:hypothetical protein
MHSAAERLSFGNDLRLLLRRVDLPEWHRNLL